MELYIGLSAVLIFCLFILLLQSITFKLLFKRFYANLLGLPIFVALAPLIFSSIVLIIHKVNTPVVGISFLLSFILSVYILKSYADAENPGEDSLLVFTGDTFWTAKKEQFIFLIILLSIPLFYVFTIEHAWVPSQFDNTSYQFIGDLLFRKHTYPLASFAGSYQIGFLPPPGFFVFDYAIRLIWNDPRSHMVLLTLALIVTSIAFARIGSLLFKNKIIEIFILIAMFSRGIFWTYWEFNVLKIFTMIPIILFVIFFFRFYYSENKEETLFLLYSQIFLSDAILIHPEFAAYTLFGFFIVIPAVFLLYLLKGNTVYIKKGFKFLAGLLIPLGFFLLWHQIVVVPIIPKLYIGLAGLISVPPLKNFLFHMTGIIPALSIFVACAILSLGKKTRKIGLMLSAMFLLIVLFAYCQYLLHFVFPDIFTLRTQTYDDFFGTSLFVIAPLVFPHNLLFKIYSLWPLSIICMGYLFYLLWIKIRSIRFKVLIALLIFPLMFFDLLYMYYNKPIISKSEYLFLKSLKKILPLDSIIIAPPGYEFSVWVGPILNRDSLSFRGEGLHAKIMTNFTLQEQIAKAYEKTDFDFFIKNFQRDKLIVIYNEPYRKGEQIFAKSNKWKIVLQDGTNFVFRYIGS